MRSLKRNLCLVLFLLFASVLYFELANAQISYYITSEKIISSGTQCADTGFEEIGTFPKGDGQIIRHCAQRAGFSYSSLYVVNSYFEVYDGVDSCKNGGDTSGSFNDISEKIVNLCVDRKTGDTPLSGDMLISNVSIVNGSGSVSCLGEDYNTGISVQVSGGNLIHCAYGGQAGGGRNKCNSNSFLRIIPEPTPNDCVYSWDNPNSWNLGINIGDNLESRLNTGGESCPSRLNCVCVSGGNANLEFNCTSIEEVEPVTEEGCVLTNARWTNLNLEEKLNANVGENLSLVADVSNECAIGRAVKCDIYKKTEELESEKFRRTLNGKVNLTTNSNTKIAFCKWNASLFSDAENTRYYFNIWFSNNASSKVRSEDIEIKNITAEEIFVEDDNENITWKSSTRHSKSEDCPQDQFIVREDTNSIYCAQFNKSNGEPIVWGEEREIGFLNTLRGLSCERYEGMVHAPKQLIMVTLGKMKCAIMQDGEGKKVGRNPVELHRKKSIGCEHDGVIYAYNIFWNRCVNDLDLVEDSEDTNDESSGEQNNRQGGLFAGLRDGPLGGILNGLLGNLGGILNMFR